MRFSTIAIVFLVLSLAVSCNRGYRSTTFAGSGFHAANADDCGKVYAGFETFLKERGFASSESPSEWDSWVGLHSEGMKRIWFAEVADVKDKIHVYADLDPRHIRTSIKWAVNGSPKQAAAAEKRAVMFALEVDDWFRSRPEESSLPPDLRDKKTKWFKARIAEISEN